MELWIFVRNHAHTAGQNKFPYIKVQNFKTLIKTTNSRAFTTEVKKLHNSLIECCQEMRLNNVAIEEAAIRLSRS